MKARRVCAAVLGASGLLGCALAGCCGHDWMARFQPPPPPAPIGTISDQYFTRQEFNAEASKNVVYQHEFKRNGVRLNWAGEDHVKQIAAQIRRNPEFPVVIERSTITADPDDKYGFPVNPNPELDMQRREVVVKALMAMGVPDAAERVVVATAYAEPLTGPQAEQAYMRTYYSNMFGNFGGGFGGFGGGFGGMGFF